MIVKYGKRLLAIGMGGFLVVSSVYANNIQLTYVGAPDIDLSALDPVGGWKIGSSGVSNTGYNPSLGLSGVVGNTVKINFNDSVANPLVTVQWGSSIYTTHFQDNGDLPLTTWTHKATLGAYDFSKASANVSQGSYPQITFDNLLWKPNVALNETVNIYSQEPLASVIRGSNATIRAANLNNWGSSVGGALDMRSPYQSADISGGGFSGNYIINGPFVGTANVDLPAHSSVELHIAGSGLDMPWYFSNTLGSHSDVINPSSQSSTLSVPITSDRLNQISESLFRVNVNGNQTGFNGQPNGYSLSTDFRLIQLSGGVNATAGLDISNPIFPIAKAANGGWLFDVGETTIPWSSPTGSIRGGWFDPEVTTGYTFQAGSGVAFAGVNVPTTYGIDPYSLSIWDIATSNWVSLGEILTPGSWFDFTATVGEEGVTKFMIDGIPTSANINPDDTRAFVTGLTFLGTGTNFTMTPKILVTGEPAPVPLPTAAWLFGSGLLGFLALKRHGKTA